MLAGAVALDILSHDLIKANGNWHTRTFETLHTLYNCWKVSNFDLSVRACGNKGTLYKQQYIRKLAAVASAYYL